MEGKTNGVAQHDDVQRELDDAAAEAQRLADVAIAEAQGKADKARKAAEANRELHARTVFAAALAKLEPYVGYFGKREKNKVIKLLDIKASDLGKDDDASEGSSVAPAKKSEKRQPKFQLPNGDTWAGTARKKASFDTWPASAEGKAWLKDHKAKNPGSEDIYPRYPFTP